MPATSRTRNASAKQPRALLRTIPGLELVEIPQGEQCCGSAGTYNLFEPESAREIGERKVDNVLQRRARICWPARTPAARCRFSRSCASGARRLRAAHPIELLDAAIRAAGDVRR